MPRPGFSGRKTDREQYGYEGAVKFVDIGYEEAPDPANGNPGGMRRDIRRLAENRAP